MNMVNTKNLLYKDYFRSMGLSLLIGLIVQYGQNLIIYFMAESMGNLTNYAALRELSLFKQEVISVLLIALISVILLPLLQVLASKLMLTSSFRHEACLLNRFFYLDYLKVKEAGREAPLNLLEDDANDFRISMQSFLYSLLEIPLIIVLIFMGLNNIPLILNLVIIGCLIGQYGVTTIFQKKIINLKQKEYAYRQKERRNSATSSENALGIKIYSAETKYVEVWQKDFASWLERDGKKLQKYENLRKHFIKLFNIVTLILVLGASAILIKSNNLTIGDVTRIFMLRPLWDRFSNKIKDLVDSHKEISGLLPRIMFYYDHARLDGEVEVAAFRHMLIDNLSYSYPKMQLDGGDGEDVFSNLKVSFSKGDCVLIYGPNGSGKSTLVKIIAGLLDPEPDTIFVNNFDKLRLNKDSWFERIYYLPQTAKLVSLTTQEEPLHLSGGEHQKMRLNEALKTSRDIIILDEPTNHLDAKSVEVLMKTISDHPATFLIVSHDKRLLELSSKVINLS